MPPASWAPPGAAPLSTPASRRRIDILTGTLGKALGGGSGGYIAAKREVVEWLRQRSRPYLFSNSIPPVVAAASIAVLDLLEGTPGLRAQLFENARFFRDGLSKAGFDLKPGEHPIIPVMLGDAALAARMAETACSATASTSSASPSRWCPRARRASARRCPPPSPASSSPAPSPPSPRSGASSA